VTDAAKQNILREIEELIAANRIEEALRALKEHALENNTLKIVSYLQAGDFERALEVAERQIERGNENALAWKASALRMLGQARDFVFDDFQLTAPMERAILERERGLVRLESHATMAACEHFERALTIIEAEPGAARASSSVTLVLVQTSRRLGFESRVQNLLQNALASPTAGGAYRAQLFGEYTDVLVALGRISDARAMVTRYRAEMITVSHQARLFLDWVEAHVCEREGDYKRALAMFERVYFEAFELGLDSAFYAAREIVLILLHPRARMRDQATLALWFERLHASPRAKELDPALFDGWCELLRGFSERHVPSMERGRAWLERVNAHGDMAFAYALQAVLEARDGKRKAFIFDELLLPCVALCERIDNFYPIRWALRFAATPEERTIIEAYLPTAALVSGLEVRGGRVWRGDIEVTLSREKCVEVLAFWLFHDAGATMDELFSSCFQDSRSRDGAKKYWYTVKSELEEVLKVEFIALQEGRGQRFAMRQILDFSLS
jgi:tetratricopeptide (TPR) repeat protein